MNRNTPLTAGRFAKRGGVNIETVRYYEQRGLLPEPGRAPSGYRLYSPAALTRLRFIKRAQELGFSLIEIQELLALRVSPGSTCADIRAQAKRKLASVNEKIVTLQRMGQALERLSRACVGDGPASECPILDALEKDFKEDS